MLVLLEMVLTKSEELLSVFEKAKKFLVGDKKTAADQLQRVSDEMMKFLVATQEEISNFQGLDFSSSSGIAQARKVLYDILSGMMEVRVIAASGSCNEIKMIYDCQLKTWFKDNFSGLSDEFGEVEKIFSALVDYDNNLTQATRSLKDYLTEKSEKILEMIEKGDQNLMSFHHQTSTELLAIRQKLSTLLSRFLHLKNEFKILSARN